MPVILDFLIVFISIIMLWKGADWLVDSAAEIAHTLPEPKLPRKRIVIPLPITEQSKEESQPSPHAREHAVSRQRASDEPDSEDSA